MNLRPTSELRALPLVGGVNSGAWQVESVGSNYLVKNAHPQINPDAQARSPSARSNHEKSPIGDAPHKGTGASPTPSCPNRAMYHLRVRQRYRPSGLRPVSRGGRSPHNSHIDKVINNLGRCEPRPYATYAPGRSDAMYGILIGPIYNWRPRSRHRRPL